MFLLFITILGVMTIIKLLREFYSKVAFSKSEMDVSLGDSWKGFLNTYYLISFSQNAFLIFKKEF